MTGVQTCALPICVLLCESQCETNTVMFVDGGVGVCLPLQDRVGAACLHTLLLKTPPRLLRSKVPPSAQLSPLTLSHLEITFQFVWTGCRTAHTLTSCMCVRSCVCVRSVSAEQTEVAASKPWGRRGRKQKEQKDERKVDLRLKPRTLRSSSSGPSERPHSLADLKTYKDTKILVARFLEQSSCSLPPEVQQVVNTIKHVIKSDEKHMEEAIFSANVIDQARWGREEEGGSGVKKNI